MPQLYTRDLAITAVICFIGGIGLTLLVVLIYYQVFHRKKLNESKREREEKERSTTVINNHVSHLDVSQKRRDVFLQASSSQPMDRKAMIMVTRLENHGDHFWFKEDEDGHRFRCLDCSTKGQRGMGPNLMRWNNRLNRGMEAEEERGKRRKPGTQQGILNRDIPNELVSPGNSNSFSHPRRDTFNERSETLPAYKPGRDMDSNRTNVEVESSGHETLHCKSCHRTYRPPEQTMRPGRIHTNMRDSALIDSFPPQHRLTDKGRIVNWSQYDMMMSKDLRRESKNVRFDLECLRNQEQGNIQGEDKREEKARTSSDKKERRNRRNVKIQSSRLLKVKLNLSPLRKSKVHPKSKNKQGDYDKISSDKNKSKRRDGKDREQKERKPNSGNQIKTISEKMTKSTKSTGSSKEENSKTEGRGEGKRKMTSKRKKTVLKNEQGSQENTAADQDEYIHPDNSQSGDATSTADQSASATLFEQGQILQGGSIQYQGAELVLGTAQLSYQHPFSLSAAEMNGTPSLPVLGSAGSQPTGSSLSPQEGNILLSNMAPGSNALFPNGLVNSLAPSTIISGPSLASSCALDNFSRQTGVGLMSPSLLANTVNANPSPASAIQTAPLHNSQAGGLALNLAASPAINTTAIQSLSQSQLPPDSSPVVATLKHDPAQGPGLQTRERLHQLQADSQTSQTKESLPAQTQALPSTDCLSGVTSHAPGSVTTVENLTNNNSHTVTGHLPGRSTVNMLASGVILTEEPAVGVSEDNMRATHVSVSGVSAPSMSTESGFSIGGTAVAAGATALLQQEYVSEEGGSSPRRKLRLVLPEKTSSRPPTALERKIR